MDEQTRLKARELLLRSRIYRGVALAFAIMGLIIFVFLYLKHVEGDVLNALRSPSIIIILAISFLPAFVLSRMAVKAEKGLAKALQQLETEQKQAQAAKDAENAAKKAEKKK